MRRPRALPVALLALGALLGSSAVALPASAAQTQGLQYVALGDSYAAGFGITPSIPGNPDPGPAPASGCLQAEQNYPHQVAAQLGLTLTDVTCTGATTANIVNQTQTTEPYFGNGGTAPVQSSALSTATDVVTVSIGGNDAGFSGVIAACVAFSATGPTFSGQQTCQQAYTVNGVDTLAQLIQGTVATNLAAAYAVIRQTAPNAQVFVVGYPALLPDPANSPQAPASCFTPALSGTPQAPSAPFFPDSVPFTDADVQWLHGIEVLLNQTIATAAANAGFAFVDNLPGSLDNSVCPQSGDPYIEGITFRSLTLANPPLTENGGMHPNVAGVAFLTAQVVPVIAAAFPDPAPAPVVPVLAVTGAEAGPTIALVVASVLMIGAGILTMVRSRRRTRPARTPR